MITIISGSRDIHALAIHRELTDRFSLPTHILECDRIAQRETIDLAIGPDGPAGSFVAHDGSRIDLGSQKVLWLRRIKADQTLEHKIRRKQARTLVNNDCAGGAKGLLSAAFRGKWVSTLASTMLGSDKIAQLSAANEAGWRIPATIVTQSKDAVVTFWRRQTQGVIVKSIVGVEGAFLLTRRLADPRKIADEAFWAAPAIYQEFVPGRRHIRLLCFGDRSLAASIDTEELDWRQNLKVPVAAWAVDDAVHARVRHCLDILGLEMGVIDLKETPEGELVWFEVNPQGQFLFLESLTDLRLAENFAAYLRDEANSR